MRASGGHRSLVGFGAVVALTDVVVGALQEARDVGTLRSIALAAALEGVQRFLEPKATGGVRAGALELLANAFDASGVLRHVLLTRVEIQRRGIRAKE